MSDFGPGRLRAPRRPRARVHTSHAPAVAPRAPRYASRAKVAILPKRTLASAPEGCQTADARPPGSPRAVARATGMLSWRPRGGHPTQEASMLDIRFVRAHPDAVRRAAAMKRIEFDVDALLAADAERRRLLQTTEELKAEQNRTSKAIAGLQGDARAARIGEMQALVARLRELDAEAKRAEEEFERL